MASKQHIPKGSWILVTGATGFVGSHTVGQLLERGYKVRGTVRDVASASWLKDVYSTYAQSESLELHEVKDLAAKGAFQNAVKGMSAVAHIATPADFNPDPNKIVTPSVTGLQSILEASLAEPGLKAFTYTSSFVAATFPVFGQDIRVTRDTWNDAAVKMAWDAKPPYDPSNGAFTYPASKVEAEKALWKFVEEKKPHFRVNVVSPSGIIGQPLHKKHVEPAYAWIKTIYDGKMDIMKVSPAVYFVDVKDIALLHVATMLDGNLDHKRIQAWAHAKNYNELLAIMRKLRPGRKFVPDFDDSRTAITTDQSEPETILKEWGTEGGWTSLEKTIAENLDSPWFN